MGYELQAVIAGDEVLRVASREVPGSHVVPLSQGMSLMPMTDEVFDAVTDGSEVGDLGFWRLPGGFESLLAQWSVAGPIAYVEAEYFGGVGEQRAAVWADGALELGPLDEPTKKRFSRAVSPISQALRRLGAQRSLGEDEFEAVGLDRHRSNEDWISSAC
ncbi:hypothetical protein [Streptomyces resistomycificus]|uniref:Uncharacterized protein n=1 Tax=Streptomyces resistomycificus TaxID=67356 RepID=A0A0L8KZU5_9ACTN|nr:hypothetical protein [Streptomyces resistomycificus]KOG31390.1 hypothetical protein ADK37_30975 [Streptomyces resistomycificus]KUN94256.1 hypothetical protein AQJ84_26545 [Streptomyces resistomycificus]